VRKRGEEILRNNPYVDRRRYALKKNMAKSQHRILLLWAKLLEPAIKGQGSNWDFVPNTGRRWGRNTVWNPEK